jgi:hypothetical protein
MAEQRQPNAFIRGGGLTLGMVIPEDASDEQKSEIFARGKKMLQERIAADQFEARIDRQPTQAPVDLSRLGTPRNPFQPPDPETAAEGNLSAQLQQAASLGVDVSSGMPARDRFRVGLVGDSPVASTLAAEHFARERLEQAGIQLPPGQSAVFVDESTGLPAYWRPTEDGRVKATLLNPPGLDAGDIAQALPGINAAVVEGLAAVTGAIVAGAPTRSPQLAAIGGATAAGTAAGVATIGRREFAKLLGVPDEIADNITNDTAMMNALFAAGIDIAAPAALGLFKGIVNGGRFIDVNTKEGRAQFDNLVRNLRESQEASAKLAERGIGDVRVTLGQASGDPDILLKELNARRRVIGGRSEQLRVQEIGAQLEVGQAVRNVHENAVRTGPTFPIENLEGTAQAALRRPLAEQEKRVLSAEASMEEMLTRQEALRNRGLFQEIQDITEQARRRTLADEAEAWHIFRNQVGYSPETRQSAILLDNRGDTPITQALRNLSQDSQQALSESAAQAQATMARDLGFGQAQQGLTQPQLDVNQLHYLMSHLKQAARSEQGKALGWREGDLRSVIDAIETQLGIAESPLPGFSPAAFRNRGGGPALGEARSDAIRASYMDAAEITRGVHRVFENDSIQKIVAQEPNGAFVHSPSQVGRFVLDPANPHVLRRTLEATGDNPSVRRGLTEEINSRYTREVFDGSGNFSQKRHNEFVDRYRDHLDMLEPGRGSDFIRNAKDMADMVKRAQVKQERIETILRNNFGRKITPTDMYPGNIVGDLMSDGTSPRVVRNVMRQLDRVEPAAAQAIREKAAVHVQNRMLAKAGNTANADQIVRIASEEGDKLGALFGKRYVEDLNLLSDAVRAVERGAVGGASKREIQPLLLQVTRTAFGPLSPIQRRLTAGTKVAHRIAERRLYDLLMSPEKLSAYVRLNRMEPGTVGFVQAFMATGLPTSMMDERDQRMAETLQNRGVRPR